jgi:hypothetical protein
VVFNRNANGLNVVDVGTLLATWAAAFTILFLEQRMLTPLKARRAQLSVNVYFGDKSSFSYTGLGQTHVYI